MAFGLPQILLTIARNLFFSIALPLVLGSLSGYPTSQVVKGEWYKNLRPPRFNPPRQTFGIVWPILYVSMGYASHLAVNAYDSAPTFATRDAAYMGITLYYCQLLLNLAWTPLFFGMKAKGLALVDLILLAGLTYYLTFILHTVTGGGTTWFLAPYSAWLTFAIYLNASYLLNNLGASNTRQTSRHRST